MFTKTDCCEDGNEQSGSIMNGNILTIYLTV